MPRLHIVDVHMLSSSGAVDGDVVDRPSTLADVDGDGDDKVDDAGRWMHDYDNKINLCLLRVGFTKFGCVVRRRHGFETCKAKY